MSVGMLGYFAFGVESSAGTMSSSVAVSDYVPVTAETINVRQAPLFSQGIRAQWDEQKVYNGLQTVGGNVAGEVHPIHMGYFLRLALDATSTTTGSGAVWANFVGSDAAWRAHRFIAAQTQFQSGSGSDLPTGTFEVYRGPAIGQGSAFWYGNMTCNVLEIVVEGGQLARWSGDFLGRRYGRKARSTPTYADIDAFLWSQCSVSIGGAGSALFESLTIRVNNNLTQATKLDGTTTPSETKRDSWRKVECSGTIAFGNDAEYDRFLAGSEFPVSLMFTAQSSARLKIDMPAFRYLTHDGPNLQGPGRIAIPFTAEAVWHPGSGTKLDIVLVNTRINPYTVNSNA
jgi:hypothetical protein